MRRLFFFGLTLLAGWTARCQDASVVTPPAYQTTLNNYIRSWQAVAPDTTAADFTTTTALTQAQMTVQYYDGLGRPVQTVVRNGSYPTGGSSVDLVTAQFYDVYGREQRNYLPFAASTYGGNTSISDGGCKSNPFQEQQNFYSSSNPASPIYGQGDTYFYSKTEFEPSPLDRVVGTYAPGNSWVHGGKGVTTGYWVNTTADSVHLWTVTGSGSPDIFSSYSGTALYAGGELYKTITADENGNQVVEFRDRENNVVLKKVQLLGAADAGSGQGHTGWLCTYYIYDSLNLLRAVVQPAGVQLLQANSWNINALSGNILGEQCFRYEYDGRRRMTMKKVPGAGVLYTVYDGRDLPVMTQDSSLRFVGKWLCTLYDAIDRPTMTALISYSGTRSQLQAVVTGQTSSYSTASVATSGQSAGTVPASYAFSTPQTGDWYASTYIDLDTGFYVNSGGQFSANIATGGTMMQSNGSIQVSNDPLPSGSTPDILTVTYYDNYNWASGTGLGTTLEMPVSSEFSTSYNTAPDYAQAVTPVYQATGLVTGTMTRVLGTNNQYVYAVSFYDDHHRLIQDRQINYKGQIDVQTTQYSFIGKPIRTFLEHDKLATATDAHNIMTRITYDDEQRESAVYQNIDGAATDQQIASMGYDALGKLHVKYLGKDLVSGNPLDSLVYDYNIRGWLRDINKSYLTGAAAHYFGMELRYDVPTSSAGSTSWNPLQYNGNIAGQVWKSAGDNVPREFEYYYDHASRLSKSNFFQSTDGGTTWTSSLLNFCTYGTDMSDPNNQYAIQYDANGNLLSMYQQGYKAGGSSVIDALQYTYYPNSNKLMQVYDGANDTASQLGDFHYKNTNKVQDTTVDYTYDGNGNLVQDNNKGIDYIIYNYLNLPQQVHMNGKGNIFYTYDAGGNKLQKQVIDSLSGLATTTTYMTGGLQYQRRAPISSPSTGTDTLQFLGHDEGRVRWAFHRHLAGDTAYGWEYDFMERDHLGNTRILLTQERDTAQYIATMEPQYRATENALFYNIDSTSYAANAVPHGGFPSEPLGPTPNDSVAMVDGAGHKIGPAILLKVMSGDSIVVGCYGYYASGGTVGTPNSSFNDLLNSLASGIVSLSGTEHGTLAAMTNPSSGPIYSAANSFLSSKDTNTSTGPKAYLNWFLLDNQLNYASGNNQSGAIPIGHPNQLNTLATNIKLNHSGFLYIWVSNETPNWNVFFDNLSVEHFSGPLIEEDHYYPFGLTIAALNDKALKTQYAQNKYRYNGKELQSQEFSDGMGLEEYDYGARRQDPQLGRFKTIDPKTEIYPHIGSYNYCFNNPMLFVDPDGMLATYNWADGKYYDNGQEVSWDQVQQQYEIGDYEDNTSVMLSPQLEGDGKTVKNDYGTGALTAGVAAAKKNGGNIRLLFVKNAGDAATQLEKITALINSLFILSHGDSKDAPHQAYFAIGDEFFHTKDVFASSALSRIAARLASTPGPLPSAAQVIVLACGAGGTYNGGVELMKALAKKLHATVYANQSLTGLSDNLFSGSSPSFTTAGWPKNHSTDPGFYHNAYLNTGNWTRTYEYGETQVSQTITNVFFDCFGKIYYTK